MRKLNEIEQKNFIKWEKNIESRKYYFQKRRELSNIFFLGFKYAGREFGSLVSIALYILCLKLSEWLFFGGIVEDPTSFIVAPFVLLPFYLYAFFAERKDKKNLRWDYLDSIDLHHKDEIIDYIIHRKFIASDSSITFKLNLSLSKNEKIYLSRYYSFIQKKSTEEIKNLYLTEKSAIILDSYLEKVEPKNLLFSPDIFGLPTLNKRQIILIPFSKNLEKFYIDKTSDVDK